MEGFLLLLSPKRAAEARLRFCVLEDGQVRCLDRPGGAALESIALTRHQIRVRALEEDASALGKCPNRFVLHAVEMARSDARNAFVVPPGARVHTYVFAAANAKAMVRWMNAVHNWRRHSFGDPVHAATKDSAAAAVHGREQLDLLDVISRFDMRLVTTVPGTGSKPAVVTQDAFPTKPSSKAERKKKQAETVRRPAIRASARIASWLPVARLSSSFRLSASS
jgi:hypothetical protein